MNQLLEFVRYSKTLDPKNKFTYIINSVSIGLVLFFMIFFVTVVKSFSVIALANFILLMFFGVFILLKKHYFYEAKFMMLLAFLIQESTLVFIWFPKATNMNHFYFVVAPITFIIFDFNLKKERHFIIASNIIATLLLILSEALPVIALVPISDNMVQTFSIMSVFSAITSITVVFYFYARNLQNIHEKLHILANTDSLTNIANRRVLFKEGEKLFDACNKYNRHFAFIIFDIDHFKRINDSYGHLVGDKVLMEVTSLLLHDIRKFDILSRYGGEEFALLLKDTDARSDSSLIAHIIDSISKHSFEINSTISLNLTISAGMTTFNGQYRNFEAMVQTADKALYQSKASGRNCYTIID